MKRLYEEYADIWHCHNRSGHLKRIKKVVKARLSALGLPYQSDNFGNILVGDFTSAKPCIVAHLDSVHNRASRTIYFDGNRLSSDNGIGADDKCGIISALECLAHCDINAVFTVDEEIGCLGADRLDKKIFAKTLYMVEVDRRGCDEVINNLCYPKSTSFEFDEAVKPIMEAFRFHFSDGTFTDLSEIVPEAKVSCINLCAGYYEAHTTKEYVVLSELANSIDFCRMLFDTIRERYEVKVEEYSYPAYRSGFSFYAEDIREAETLADVYEAILDLYGHDDILFEAIKRAYEIGVDEANKPDEPVTHKAVLPVGYMTFKPDIG